MQETAVQAAPTRNPFAMLVCVLGAFAAGPALGAVAAQLSAPRSELAQIVSPLAFALAFAGGLSLWFGVGVVALVGDALRRVLRGGWRWRRSGIAAEAPLPPGHGAFVPLSLLLGLAAGVVAGLVPQSGSFAASCALHVAAGGGYGALLRSLARRGYLPFPEPG